MNKLSLQRFTNIKTASEKDILSAVLRKPSAEIEEMMAGIKDKSLDVTKLAAAIPQPPEYKSADQAVMKGSGSVGVFLSSQSIVTFPVASVLVTTIWKVFSAIFPEFGNSNVSLLCISLIVGLVIYYISLTPQMTRKEKVVGAIVAFFNCILLVASALGISTTITPTAHGA